MKRFRKQLAVALVTTMMVSSFSFNGIAAEYKGKWVLNNGEWNYRENGEIIKNQILQYNGEKYYIKEDGIMASDEFFQPNDGGTRYAFPEGKIASGWWLYLDDEGHQLPDLQNGNWYYFDNNGIRMENSTPRIGKYRYAFDEDGKMLSRAFLEDGKKYYYEYDGQMAKDKWLNIDGDWYYFETDGSCKKASKASDSNASMDEFDEEGRLISDTTPCRTIEDIKVKGSDERNGTIGKELKVTFNVELATDSNAKKQTLTGDHDFWIEEVGSSGTYKRGWEKSLDGGKNEYTISYIPYAIETFQLKLVIDGIESHPVTITSDWSSGSDKIGGIGDTLSGNWDVSNRVASIKTLCQSLDDNSQIKETWINKIRELRVMDNSFAMLNRNMVSIDAAGVKSLLGTGELDLIGGSLNAAQGEEISLSATKGTVAALPEAFEKQLSVELDLYKGGDETHELDVPVIVGVPVPSGMSAEGLKVFHIGEDGSPELLNTKIDGNMVYLVTDSFSNFVFAGKAVQDSSGSNNSGGGSGSGSSGGSGFNKKSSSTSSIPETSGQWQQTESGWSFKKPNGDLYQNTWIYVNGKWYWIEPDGIMAQGWKELNGKKYYLMPAMGEMLVGWILDGQNWYYTDGNGVMQTGWVNVGEKWYYLGADGHMLSSATTPDGYSVDENGVWIQ
jgi:glucan-binding YG repeat protein